MTYVTAAGEQVIRDLSYPHTPKAVEPWTLTATPNAASAVYSIWCETAATRLAYVLPYEIREVEGEQKVVLKGPGSAPVDIADVPAGWGTETIGTLSEAASWIYVEEFRTRPAASQAPGTAIIKPRMATSSRWRAPMAQEARLQSAARTHRHVQGHEGGRPSARHRVLEDT